MCNTCPRSVAVADVRSPLRAGVANTPRRMLVGFVVNAVVHMNQSKKSCERLPLIEPPAVLRRVFFVLGNASNYVQYYSGRLSHQFCGAMAAKPFPTHRLPLARRAIFCPDSGSLLKAVLIFLKRAFTYRSVQPPQPSMYRPPIPLSKIAR